MKVREWNSTRQLSVVGSDVKSEWGTGRYSLFAQSFEAVLHSGLLPGLGTWNALLWLYFRNI